MTLNISKYIAYPQSKINWGRLRKQNHLTERFIGTDTGFELFFNIFTSGIETFVMPWDQVLYSCVVEVCRLGLESVCHTLCYSENADTDQTGISSGVSKDGPQY